MKMGKGRLRLWSWDHMKYPLWDCRDHDDHGAKSTNTIGARYCLYLMNAPRTGSGFHNGCIHLDPLLTIRVKFSLVRKFEGGSVEDIDMAIAITPDPEEMTAVVHAERIWALFHCSGLVSNDSHQSPDCD